MNEVKVVSVTSCNKPIFKARTHRGIQFCLETELELANGTNQSHVITRDRKKDIPNALASEQRAAASGAMSVSFDDEGNVLTVCTRYTMGASGGLVPATAEEMAV